MSRHEAGLRTATVLVHGGGLPHPQLPAFVSTGLSCSVPAGGLPARVEDPLLSLSQQAQQAKASPLPLSAAHCKRMLACRLEPECAGMLLILHADRPRPPAEHTGHRCSRRRQ